MKLSIISPVYQAEEIVDELILRITQEASKITDDFEILLVEDGSADNSWSKIKNHCKHNSHVVGIKLSRNFGQHYAITAGIQRAKGDYIILMDCDLQDNPKYFSLLIEQAEIGFDIVFTKREKRKHGFFKSVNSNLYNLLFRLFSDRRYDVNAGSLILFTKRIGLEFLKIKDKDRLYLQIFKWLGFRNTTIEVEHEPRYSGKSSYKFLDLLKLGLQGWTSHSDKLLKMSVYIGFFMALFSFVSSLVILVATFIGSFQPGWPSLIVVIFFSTGLILLSIGIAGIYIGKTFDQVKDRPLFIIEEELNYEG
ncbi:hypothetical protein OB69_08185 [Roseivirga seohaensis subsp. aquiponti]|uniref:Glycosyltransferase 2-like domain-containing protein n=1 Tax=Roseivirga seohaensis subsp. aquiponti TaxID=1566026 RepID=A0A0L8AM64_9BACT|nr:glycosyltransferase family 2 protein [Roseivirga seohaensis]KOF03265.1 hypothetical protein OB69_08185 [Roseivirga seohaensis subsp. aquiponti]